MMDFDDPEGWLGEPEQLEGYQDRVPSPCQSQHEDQRYLEVGAPPTSPVGGTADYIPFVATSAAADQADLPHGYWQRHTEGKRVVQQAIRRWFLTGETRYRGKWIRTRGELARFFDQQLIATVERKLAMWRIHWRSTAKAAPPVVETRTQVTKRTRLQFVTFNCATAHGERLPAICKKFWWASVIFVARNQVHAEEGTQRRKDDVAAY